MSSNTKQAIVGTLVGAGLGAGVGAGLGGLAGRLGSQAVNAHPDVTNLRTLHAGLAGGGLGMGLGSYLGGKLDKKEKKKLKKKGQAGQPGLSKNGTASAVGLWDCGMNAPTKVSRVLNPYVATVYDNLPISDNTKSALMLPPRPLLSPAQAGLQPPNIGPYAQPAAPQQSMVPGAGAGRPSGSTGQPGAITGNPVPQTGMPGQPSAVASMSGSSTQQTKGFGNTPTGGTAGTKSKGTGGGAKSANAMMGYGTSAGKLPMSGGGMNMTGPMSMSMPTGVGTKMPALGSQMGTSLGMAAGSARSPISAISPKIGHSVHVNSKSAQEVQQPTPPQGRVGRTAARLRTDPTLDNWADDMGTIIENVGAPAMKATLPYRAAGSLGASAGIPIGALLGLYAGMRRDRPFTGLVRGGLRGLSTGSGAGIGSVAGSQLARLASDDPTVSALGTALGAGAGGLGGWMLSGKALGKPSTSQERLKEEEQSKEKKSDTIRPLARPNRVTPQSQPIPGLPNPLGQQGQAPVPSAAASMLPAPVQQLPPQPPQHPLARAGRSPVPGQGMANSNGLMNMIRGK